GDGRWEGWLWFPRRRRGGAINHNVEVESSSLLVRIVGRGRALPIRESGVYKLNSTGKVPVLHELQDASSQRCGAYDAVFECLSARGRDRPCRRYTADRLAWHDEIVFFQRPEQLAQKRTLQSQSSL